MERKIADYSLPGLEALAAVARSSSLAKAGQLLGVSGSAISKQLTRLESRLGTRLLRRTTRSVALSPAGIELAAEYVRSRNILEQALDSVREDGAGPRGLLRISAPPAFGIHLLPRILKDFVRRYPEVIVDLDLTGRLVNVTGEGYDVAVRVASAPPQEYVAQEIAGIVWGLYGSRDYLSRRGKPRTPEDLQAHSCIATSSRAGKFRLEMTGPSCLAALTVSPALVTRSVEATHALVSEGAGLGILPDYLGRSRSRGDGLQRILPAWSVAGDRGSRIYALMLPGRSLRPAARAFVEFLRARLRRRV